MATATLVLLPLPADAAPYPPTEPCAVDAATTYSSTDVVGFRLSGRGFAPGEDVALWLGHPDVRAAATAARADGSVSAAFTVSRRTADASEILTAVSASASCTVPTPPVPGPGGGGNGGGGNGGGNGAGGNGGGNGNTDGNGGNASGGGDGGGNRTGTSSAGSGSSAAPTRPGGNASSSGATTTAGVPSPSSGTQRTAPPRADDTQDVPSIAGLPAWLIAGISIALLVLGLLATRLLTRRSE